MKWSRVAAGMLAAGYVAAAPAQSLLSEGFDSVAALAGAGWVFTNASAPPGVPWFQGNAGIFEAQSGAAASYVAANFNSTTAVEGVLDNWLISPEITLGAGASLSFFTQSADAGYFDLLEVRFSSGAGTALADFSTLLGTVGAAASASYPVGSWAGVTLSLPAAASGRIAFRYLAANAANASYIGIDTLSVNAVPEPATLALWGAGLAALRVAARRRARAV